MTFIRTILITIVFVLPRLSIFAQPVFVFEQLEKSIKNNEREEVVKYYNQICISASDPDFNNQYFEQLLEFSHDLSRLGYSEEVFRNLEKLSSDGIVTRFAIKYYSGFYNELGYAYYYNNQIEKSDSIFRLNLFLKEKSDDIPNLDISFSLNFLGLIQRRNGNVEKAIEYFEKAKLIRINELGENHPQVGSIVNNIGLAYKTMGDFEKAREYFEKAVEIKLFTDDPSVYLNYLNLGELKTILGNYSAALVYYEKAEIILEDSDQPVKLADLYVNMGVVYNLLKANRESYMYYQKALSVYVSIYGEESEEVAKVYQNLAIVYDELEDQENEQKATQKAVSIFENLYGNEPVEIAPLYNNLGLVYQNHGKFDEALIYLQKALDIYQKFELEHSEMYLNTLGNIAENFKLSGQIDSAAYYYQDAVNQQVIFFNSNHPLLANTLNQLAGIYLNKKDFVSAFNFAEKAIIANSSDSKQFYTINETCLDPSYLFDSYLILGKLYSAEENNSEFSLIYAMKCFDVADSILSLQRNFLFDKKDKVNLARNSKLLAYAVLESLWKKETQINEQDLELAFYYMEKSKNLVLLQSVAENQGKNFAGIPKEIIQREDEIRGNINYFSHQIEIEKDSLSRLKHQEILFAKKQEYKILVELLEKEYSSYYDLKYREDLPDIKEIQSVLNDSTIVLNYFTFNNTLFSLSVSNTECFLNKFQVNNLDDLLTGMRKGITLKLDKVYLEKAHQLNKILIPENLKERYKKLIIIPDGGLSLIPFEALLTEPVNSEQKINKWPFLINDFQISYSPSFALWLKFKNQKGNYKEGNSLLAFAPVFDHQGQLEISENESFSALFSLMYNSKINELGKAPLLASKSEIKQIDSLFTKNNFRTNIFLESEASERNISTIELHDYRFIHIATHGFVDEKKPELSGLYFAPLKQEGFDNILYTGEIYNLKLDVDLLTLSACETALGKIAEGEGLLGFSRAFLYTGTKNLLLSLWKVNDFSTEKLMVSFYSNILEKQMSFSEALTSAKHTLIQNKEYSHPFYWAPFILMGN